MSPENWPEPIGRVVELNSLDAVDVHVEEMPDVGETIYTATQVREIVRMEVESISKLVKAEWLTEADREYGERLAALIRARLKENKNAD
jgi:hypothetical protein